MSIRLPRFSAAVDSASPARIGVPTVAEFIVVRTDATEWTAFTEPAFILTAMCLVDVLPRAIVSLRTLLVTISLGILLVSVFLRTLLVTVPLNTLLVSVLLSTLLVTVPRRILLVTIPLSTLVSIFLSSLISIPLSLFLVLGNWFPEDVLFGYFVVHGVGCLLPVVVRHLRDPVRVVVHGPHAQVRRFGVRWGLRHLLVRRPVVLRPPELLLRDGSQRRPTQDGSRPGDLGWHVVRIPQRRCVRIAAGREVHLALGHPSITDDGSLTVHTLQPSADRCFGFVQGALVRGVDGESPGVEVDGFLVRLDDVPWGRVDGGFKDLLSLLVQLLAHELLLHVVVLVLRRVVLDVVLVHVRLRVLVLIVLRLLVLLVLLRHVLVLLVLHLLLLLVLLLMSVPDLLIPSHDLVVPAQDLILLHDSDLLLRALRHRADVHAVLPQLTLRAEAILRPRRRRCRRRLGDAVVALGVVQLGLCARLHFALRESAGYHVADGMVGSRV